MTYRIKPDGDTALMVTGYLPVLEHRPCDTCDGHSEVFASRDIERPELDRWYRCPDCDGTGRHTFTVEVECGVRGCDDPPLPLTVHVIDVLPIMDVPDTGYPHPKPERFAYVSKAGSLRIVDSTEQTDTFIGKLPSAAEPGMWLIRLAIHTPENVEEP